MATTSNRNTIIYTIQWRSFNWGKWSMDGISLIRKGNFCLLISVPLNKPLQCWGWRGVAGKMEILFLIHKGGDGQVILLFLHQRLLFWLRHDEFHQPAATRVISLLPVCGSFTRLAFIGLNGRNWGKAREVTCANGNNLIEMDSAEGEEDERGGESPKLDVLRNVSTSFPWHSLPSTVAKLEFANCN